jgi:hypothetical protein
MQTEILQRGEPRYNMVGQRLPDTLSDTGQEISAGLAARLHRYALARLPFDVTGWTPNAYTMDADLAPSERFYCVEFTNAQGGCVGVQGIMIGRGGHPCLDHGLSIAEKSA